MRVARRLQKSCEVVDCRRVVETGPTHHRTRNQPKLLALVKLQKVVAVCGLLVDKEVAVCRLLVEKKSCDVVEWMTVVRD